MGSGPTSIGSDGPLFNDQWVTPSAAGQVAETALVLLDKGEWDTYHISGNLCITNYT